MTRSVFWVQALVVSVLLVVIGAGSLWLLPMGLADWLPEDLVGRDRTDAIASARTATVALVASFATASSVFVAARSYVSTRSGLQAQQMTSAAAELFSESQVRRIAGVHMMFSYARIGAPARRVACAVLSAFVREATSARRDEDPLDEAVLLALSYLTDRRVSRGESVNLTGARLDDVQIIGKNLKGWIFDDCRLDGANFSGSNLRNASFRSASLAGVTMTRNRGAPGIVDFESADTRGINWK